MCKNEHNFNGLTIGIPLRNEEESIEKCLQAIFRSDLPENTEIVICDNRSTDKSIEYVSKMQNKEIQIVTEPKLGKAFAMNKIIKRSSFDIIVFCDADVLVKPDTLKRIYNKLKNSDLHMVGIGLIDISTNKFFKWYYQKLVKIQKDDVINNAMGGCFGINQKKFKEFPPVLSSDFFISAYYYFGDQKSLRDDSIGAYYKKANTVRDVLMKKTRNRLKYLQIKKDFPKLATFPYEPAIDYKKLRIDLSVSTFIVFLLHSFFETIAFIAGTIVFYATFKNVGYSWRKAKSTKLQDVNVALLNMESNI